MTHRICANLDELDRHPALNPNFRAAVRHLHEHWLRLGAKASGSCADAHAGEPWAPGSPTLQ
ncbi:hypothetical protein WG922_07550 [Ramlibacter sp. AN1015]|uniref:hypothetical protein n=1 Tax=Ramlibacter sp. AN1015 TaxID=3133428 RepID=UPI0030C2F170